jgi:hypothetical protein
MITDFNIMRYEFRNIEVSVCERPFPRLLFWVMEIECCSYFRYPSLTFSNLSVEWKIGHDI